MTPVQTDATNKKDKDGWLVMLYLAGDNNLAEDMVLSLQELIAEGVPTETGSLLSWILPAPISRRHDSTLRRRAIRRVRRVTAPRSKWHSESSGWAPSRSKTPGALPP